MILGIDEVGRGAWAGPLVVGAVVLGDAKIDGLADSKLLTAKKRQSLASEINEKAASVGLGWVAAAELDKIGLSEALRLATRRAVEQINVPYHEIIIDGTINFLSDTNKGRYVTNLAKADQLIPSVSAASIVAKVARDEYMKQQDDKHGDYGFSSHVGYGTSKHHEELRKRGVTPIHRISFKPVGDISSSKDVGNEAENLVENYLKSLGHDILDRNWKTKVCEIDIISRKSKHIYFTEVKYRNKPTYGDGLEAITRSKLRQMKFATEIYMKNIDNSTYSLAVASVSGSPMKLDDWFEIV